MTTIQIRLLLFVSIIAITSISTTNVFAQNFGNVSTHHYVAKLTGYFAIPIPKINMGGNDAP